MYARIVDFGGQDYDCAKVDMLIIHLRRLGFSVELDYSMVQPTDESCGAVAALAAARLSEADWRTADVSLAVHPNIISNAQCSSTPQSPIPISKRSCPDIKKIPSSP